MAVALQFPLAKGVRPLLSAVRAKTFGGREGDGQPHLDMFSLLHSCPTQCLNSLMVKSASSTCLLIALRAYLAVLGRLLKQTTPSTVSSYEGSEHLFVISNLACLDHFPIGFGKHITLLGLLHSKDTLLQLNSCPMVTLLQSF